MAPFEEDSTVDTSAQSLVCDIRHKKSRLNCFVRPDGNEARNQSGVRKAVSENDVCVQVGVKSEQDAAALSHVFGKATYVPRSTAGEVGSYLVNA